MHRVVLRCPDNDDQSRGAKSRSFKKWRYMKQLVLSVWGLLCFGPASCLLQLFWALMYSGVHGRESNELGVRFCREVLWYFFCYPDATMLTVPHRLETGQYLNKLVAVCGIFACGFNFILPILRQFHRVGVLRNGMTHKLRFLVTCRFVVPSSKFVGWVWLTVNGGNSIYFGVLQWRNFLIDCVCDVRKLCCVRSYHAFWWANVSIRDNADKDENWLFREDFNYTTSCDWAMAAYKQGSWFHCKKSIRVCIEEYMALSVRIKQNLSCNSNNFKSFERVWLIVTYHGASYITKRLDQRGSLPSD